MDAGIYVRLSENPDGVRTGLVSQEEDCRGVADQRGWNVVAVYADDDTSASASKGKPREAYERLFADVRAGKIQAIIYQTNSRLTRRVREYLDIIDLVRDTGVQLASVRGGDHDLTTADGRGAALTVAVWDAAEAERTAERVKRNIEHKKKQGKPLGSGMRRYGYTRDFELIPEEAAIVKEVFERVAAGEGLYGIAQDLTARGLKTSTDKPFKANTLQYWLTNTTYAGFNEYGTLEIEPIVTRALFDAANATRKPGRPAYNARVHLLSGIAICGECHNKMSGFSPDGGRYKCEKAHGGCGLSIKKVWLDDAIRREVLRKHQMNLDTPDPVNRSTEIAAAEVTIKQIQDSDLDFTDKVRWIQTERDKINEWRSEEATSISDVQMILESYDQWDDAEIGRNRTLVSRYVSYVEVARGPRGARAFDPARVLIHWQDGTQSHPEAGVVIERHVT